MRINLNIISIFLLLAIGSIVVKAQTTTNASQDKAYELHENKKFAEAAEMYEELLKRTTKTLTCSACAVLHISLRKNMKSQREIQSGHFVYITG